MWKRPRNSKSRKCFYAPAPPHQQLINFFFLLTHFLFRQLSSCFSTSSCSFLLVLSFAIYSQLFFLLHSLDYFTLPPEFFLLHLLLLHFFFFLNFILFFLILYFFTCLLFFFLNFLHLHLVIFSPFLFFICPPRFHFPHRLFHFPTSSSFPLQLCPFFSYSYITSPLFSIPLLSFSF